MAIDISKIIRDRRKELDLTLEQVGDACGVGKSTVRKWETGSIKNMGRDKLPLLASILRMDPADLIDYPSNTYALPQNVYTISQLQHHKVKVVGSMAAGEPIFDEEFPDVIVDGPLNADLALKVKGDSMSPEYLDGDLVFIKNVPDLPHNGTICVISVDDEAALKRVYHDGDHVTLTSTNPAYGPMTYSFKEHLIRILGVPVGFLRMYKK